MTQYHNAYYKAASDTLWTNKCIAATDIHIAYAVVNVGSFRVNSRDSCLAITFFPILTDDVNVTKNCWLIPA